MQRLCLRAVLALIGTGIGASAAMADGKLEARYRMSLGGLELGRAAYLVEVGDTSYTASGSGRLTGVVQAVSSGKGTVGARGTIERGALAPRSFAMDAQTDKKTEGVRLVMNAAATVTEVKVEPPVPTADDRVPITDKDKKGVFDPITATLIMVPGTDNPVSAKACERVLAIFDGRARYDLELSFERIEPVKADKGYAGPAVVCRIAYKPISGHKPSRSGVKYMMNNKEMFIWLAPVAGTRVLAPFKASVATAIGVAEMQATSFITEPMIGRKATPAKASP